MKFILEKDRGLLKESSTATTVKTKRSGVSGQTALKEYIVDAVNNSLGLDLQEEDYCVHHLFGEHTNNSADEVSITTHRNHSAITKHMLLCDWDALADALQECYTLKVYAKRLISKDIKNIINELKKRMSIVTDPKTGKRWRIFSYDIWHTATVMSGGRATKEYREFETADELNSFVEELKSKR